ncbi:hypothetical protein V7122_10930, partial [Bacillus sp. JJ1532]|uniref:hypothetical protein n=1 Tax=Bacillus sp. JJ1532 TaxID=3122958 RepID=UPI002FFFDF55
FNEFDISIPKLQPKHKIVQRLKMVLPKSMRNFMMYILNKYFQQNIRNYNNFNQLAEKLLQNINSKESVENIYLNQNINHVFSIWFLEKLLKID